MYELVKGRKVKNGLKVFVYFNLHKKCFSVMALEGEYKRLVVLHAYELVLINAVFSVNQKRRAKVLIEKSKNVHAGVIGYLNTEIENVLGEEVTYNPYLYTSFVYVDNKKEISKAEKVFFQNRKLFAVV